MKVKAGTLRQLGEILAQATAAPGGGVHLPIGRVDRLRALGEELKEGGQRGRPRNDDIRDMAQEYHTRRIRDGLSHAAARDAVMQASAGPGFVHGKRRPRSDESFRRQMRAERDAALEYMDLIWATPEQVAEYRAQLDDRSKPKSKRARK